VSPTGCGAFNLQWNGIGAFSPVSFSPTLPWDGECTIVYYVTFEEFEFISGTIVYNVQHQAPNFNTYYASTNVEISSVALSLESISSYYGSFSRF